MAKSLKELAAVVGTAFDAIRESFLPGDKSLVINWHSTLPGLYEAATRSVGGRPDAESVSSLLEIANTYIDALEARAAAELQHVVRSATVAGDHGTQAAETDRIDEIIEKTGEELQRIVDTEAQRARAAGSLDGIGQVSGSLGDNDPTVFFVVVRDDKLCVHCRRLHLMPDGQTPRVYKTSELSSDYFHPKTNDKPTVQGLHPHCFTGSMQLHTSAGLLSMQEMFDSGKHLDVVVDKRIKARRFPANQFGEELPGTSWMQRHDSGSRLRHATSVFDTGVRKCLRITLAGGHQIEVSADHEMWVDDGLMGRRVKASELQLGEKVPLISGPTPFGTDSFQVQAELMGNLAGDGTTTGQWASWHFFGAEIEYGKRLRAAAIDLAPGLAEKSEPEVVSPDDKYAVERWSFASGTLARLLVSEFGFSKKPRRVPARLWTADEATVSAFLRGLFSADGHAELNSVVLAQNDLVFLREIQRLLSMFGLNSRIFTHGEAMQKTITYADGTQHLTNRKPCWRLHLSGYRDAVEFQRKIGFGPVCKQQKLEESLVPGPGGQKWRTSRVSAIEDIGEQQTYSITEHMTNTVTVNGIVTGQCRCSLTYLPRGWGFNGRGYITYVGPDHDEWRSQRQA